MNQTEVDVSAHANLHEMGDTVRSDWPHALLYLYLHLYLYLYLHLCNLLPSTAMPEALRVILSRRKLPGFGCMNP